MYLIWRYFLHFFSADGLLPRGVFVIFCRFLPRNNNLIICALSNGVLQVLNISTGKFNHDCHGAPMLVKIYIFHICEKNIYILIFPNFLGKNFGCRPQCNRKCPLGRKWSGLHRVIQNWQYNWKITSKYLRIFFIWSKE